ncbi:Reversibly glycosylated polypeptide 1 [Hibiscus syriacus]|uniref:Reversibly glycosylated polypeptide 1 n=1 Tax=Hibiscus syriacus TaxID=106335 RepID=A0A6A2YE30_HIBSY|nr:Reversibly glycosylated polypeptide 1 [Hibiscus syriacus]
MVSTHFFNAATLLLVSSLVIVSAIDYSQGSHPDINKPTPKAKEKPLPIGVEGHILCKSGTSSPALPVQGNNISINITFALLVVADNTGFIGAVARITCLAVDESGYETAPFSFLSGETDKNGYFFATLTRSDKLQLRQCKAFLKKSPLKDCQVPTDVNRGIGGAVLDSYRVLNHKKIRLYWVAPFYYTSDSNGYKQ